MPTGMAHRRSGLRSFPRRCPSTQLVQIQLHYQTLQLRVLLLKLLQSPRLVHLQPTELFAPAVVRLLRDGRLLTGKSIRLPVGHADSRITPVVYTQALSTNERDAQSKVVRMIVSDVGQTMEGRYPQTRH